MSENKDTDPQKPQKPSAAEVSGATAYNKLSDSLTHKAASGGTTAGGAAAGAVGNAAEAVQAAANKDAVGATDAVVRGAASGAASVLGSPVAGAAVGTVLESKTGRKVSRGVTRTLLATARTLLVTAAVIVIVFLVLAAATVVAVMSSASAIISNSEATETATTAVYTEICSIALPPLVEATGTAEDKENGEDVITPEEAAATNAELNSRTYSVGTGIVMSRQEVEAFQDEKCSVGALPDLGQLSTGGYVIAPSEDLVNPFTDTGMANENASVAVRRAMMFVGNAHLACSDGMCLGQCDGLAAEIWGYSNSGFASANTHWQHAVDNGYANPGDMNPPIGALLYWDTGHEYGHVATYVGNGMVVSNLTTSAGVSNVYLMPAAQWSQWHPYRGWSDPVFRGAVRPNTGFDR